MNKGELVNYVKHQIGVDLPNEKGGLNNMRNVLYTQIRRVDYNAVMSLLHSKGIRTESHIKDYYFIHIA